MPVVVLVDSLQMAFDKVRHLRARAYDAHVAPENIEELRQFVQIQLAQESGIVGSGPSPHSGCPGVRAFMVRNFNMVKMWTVRPTRSCAKKTGPGLLQFDRG